MQTLPLRVKNLVKKYGNFTALDEVSFEINKGEIFALIGPNGAGKSTAIKIIATILTPTAGEVEVHGYSVSHKANDVRGLISYLPEEAGAYKNLSGKAYFSLMADLYSKSATDREKFYQKAVLISGLNERLKDKVGTYSKGMTRKLLVARTVMSEPTLAILDEPTSGLDVTNATQVRNIVKKLAKDGMAVMLSSHNMLEIEHLADRLAIINKGIIIAQGTSSELKKKHQAQNLEEVFIKLTS